MDCMDDPKKYDGKTVKFLAQVCQTNRAGKDSFVPGRFAMTCCVQDIQFVGFPCRYDGYTSLDQRSWITLTAKINLKYPPPWHPAPPRLRAPGRRFCVGGEKGPPRAKKPRVPDAGLCGILGHSPSSGWSGRTMSRMAAAMASAERP